MLLLSAKCSRPPAGREKLLARGESENHLKDKWLNIIRFLHWTSQGSSNLARKGLPGTFLGFASIAGGIWKGDGLVSEMEELENLAASEIHPQRLNAKESIDATKG